MKPNNYGIFATTKNLDANIQTYKTIYDTYNKLGLKMYRPWIVKDYPLSKDELDKKARSIVRGTNRQVRSIDFAVADFSTKSRTVFFQTITALENKVPVLCIYSEGLEHNIPSVLSPYKEDLLITRSFKDLKDLEKVLTEYVNEIDPPKKRFNVVLKTDTLKQMEQLSSTKNISKAELIRRLIAKEYRRVFGSEE